MNEILEVYKLQPDTDDRRLEGFGTKDSPMEMPSLLGRESFEDDLVAGFDVCENPRWVQPRFGDRWVPIELEGRVREYNDYPCFNLTEPVFSERAVEVLRDMLEPNGELLPVKTKLKTKFYFYNILTASDALDLEKSEIDWFSDSPNVLACGIDYYVFDPEKVKELSIFRIYPDPPAVFVTRRFVDRVEKHGLKGFDFIKVWPLPPGTNCYLYHNKNKKQEREARAKLHQHSLIIVLPLTGQSGEREKIARFEDCLDERLAVQHSEDEPYYGNYEGHDEVEGEYRMFLSCPDAQRLYKYLEPDIQSIGWPVNYHVYVREGEIFDAKAPEQGWVFEPAS